MEFPSYLVHAHDFIQHFVLFFLVPIISTICCAVLAAAIFLRIRRVLWRHYATPEELLEEAVQLLKGDGPTVKSFSRKASARRDRALQTLRLIIRLEEYRPVSLVGGDLVGRGNAGAEKLDMLQPYTLLATELFYGEIKNGQGKNDRDWRKALDNAALRRRGAQAPESSQNAASNMPPALLECEEVIKQGLSIDPSNKELLKLQNEVQLVKKYGTDGAHTKMMNIGSFGWVNG